MAPAKASPLSKYFQPPFICKRPKHREKIMNPTSRTQIVPLIGLLMVQIFIATASGAEAQSTRDGPQSISVTQAVSITDLRTEGVVQPLGIEEAAPRFSWRNVASSQAPRGFQQTYANGRTTFGSAFLGWRPLPTPCARTERPTLLTARISRIQARLSGI